MINNVPSNIDMTNSILENEDEEILAELYAEEAMYLANDQEELDAMIESADIKALTEARRFRKKTLVKFSKVDDLTRRAHNLSLIIADRLGLRQSKELEKIRAKEKKLLKEIYGNPTIKSKAYKLAKQAQRDIARTPTFSSRQQKKFDKKK